MLADLHIHTTFSDGIYTPDELVAQAAKVPLKAMAFTDHDNMQAYPVVRRLIEMQHLPIILVRGVEIDTDYRGKDVHITGYHFNPDDRALRQALAWTRIGRVGRIHRIVEKINQMGYPLTLAEVKAEAGESKSLGRPHIARVLVKKGLFPSVNAVFDALIGAGKPAYCRQNKLSPKEAVSLLHGAGGIAVLAHPAEINHPDMVETLLSTVPFDGMEVWHPSVLKDKYIQVDWFALAKSHHLLPSGGSDLHGNPGRFPQHLCEFKVEYEAVKGIVTAKGWE